jgi:hypothetical protein
MKTISALGKMAVGSLVVTFLGIAPGCGPSIGAYCDKVCDCQGCSDTQRDDCIDTADDARRNADHKGCRGEFDKLLSCGMEELECKDGYPKIDGCDSEQKKYLECVAGTPSSSGSGGYGGYNDGGYGGDVADGGWGGYGGEGGWGGAGEGGWGGTGGAGGSGGGACVGCGEYITTSEFVDVCEGYSSDVYNALAECVCAGPCEAVCGDNLCSGTDLTNACQGCVLDTNGGCGNEYNECANDF